MKTNYLFFKQRGSQVFTYSTGAQEFTLADAGTGNFDEDIAADTRVKVVVTSSGTDTTIPDNGKSISANVITIAAASGNGADLVAGDTITITQIPAEGTEVSFRSDRFLGVRTTSDTVTVISFKAGDDESFATTNDAVTLTHNSNANAARLISSAMEEAVNSETGTGFVDVLDREAATGVLTKTGLSFTDLQLSIQA